MPFRAPRDRGGQRRNETVEAGDLGRVRGCDRRELVRRGEDGEGRPRRKREPGGLGRSTWLFPNATRHGRLKRPGWWSVFPLSSRAGQSGSTATVFPACSGGRAGICRPAPNTPRRRLLATVSGVAAGWEWRASGGAGRSAQVGLIRSPTACLRNAAGIRRGAMAAGPRAPKARAVRPDLLNS